MSDPANEFLARLHAEVAKAKANVRRLINETISDPAERERIWTQFLQEEAELLERG